MLAKLRRTVFCLFPVDKNRTGNCVSCGACCKLPVPCPFLRYNEEQKSYCAIYTVRPPNCRKYPRTAGEQLTADTCGFRFEAGEPQTEVAAAMAAENAVTLSDATLSCEPPLPEGS